MFSASLYHVKFLEFSYPCDYQSFTTPVTVHTCTRPALYILINALSGLFIKRSHYYLHISVKYSHPSFGFHRIWKDTFVSLRCSLLQKCYAYTDISPASPLRSASCCSSLQHTLSRFMSIYPLSTNRCLLLDGRLKRMAKTG